MDSNTKTTFGYWVCPSASSCNSSVVEMMKVMVDNNTRDREKKARYWANWNKQCKKWFSITELTTVYYWPYLSTDTPELTISSSWAYQFCCCQSLLPPITATSSSWSPDLRPSHSDSSPAGGNTLEHNMVQEDTDQCPNIQGIKYLWFEFNWNKANMIIQSLFKSFSFL